MKTIRLTYFLLFYLATVVLFPVHLGAQEIIRYSKSAIDSIVNPPLLKGSEAILKFDSCKKHIGTLSEEDAPRTYHFTFRNISSSAVSITRVNTSCGCTVATFQKEPIASGAESTIALTYNPHNHVGTVDTEAFVYITASSKQPVARLTLLGNVTSSDEWSYLPHVAGALRMKRKQVVFSEVKPSMQPSERILCANSGKTSLKLSALMLPTYASFRTEPVVLAPGQEGDLVITIDSNKIPAQAGKEYQFSFLIEGIKVRPTDRTIKVTIKRTH